MDRTPIQERRYQQRKKWASQNRDRLRQLNRNFRLRNREKRNRESRLWRLKNPIKVKENFRTWRLKNTAHLRCYKANLRQTNPLFRVTENLRSRVRQVLHGKKSAPTLRLIGLTAGELKAYLESKFKSGMTWENYGKVWEIDHIRPCANFNLLEVEQQKICFHWSNLQPLFSVENKKKGARCPSL